MALKLLGLCSLIRLIPVAIAASSDLITSLSSPFEIIIQFDRVHSLQGYHLANVQAGSANQGLVIGLNGPDNPGNLAQQFLFTNSQLITSLGAVTYGDKTTNPSDTRYPLAPLSKIKESEYLEFVPSKAPEKDLAFIQSTQYQGYYELANGDGSRLNISFGQLYLSGRYAGVISGPGENSKIEARPVRLLTSVQSSG